MLRVDLSFGFVLGIGRLSLSFGTVACVHLLDLSFGSAAPTRHQTWRLNLILRVCKMNISFISEASTGRLNLSFATVV